jgi:hypothetical protein
MQPAAQVRPQNHPANQQGNAAPTMPTIPFVNAAHEHTEPFLDQTIPLGASAVNIGPINVPSYGYLRHIFLECSFSGGTLGAGVLSTDFPWNVFQSLTLMDTNGAPIYGPLDGYATYIANLVGGYAFKMDPAQSPWFSSTINGAFFLRIPIEISHHDGLGALANQNSAATYQLYLTVNPSTVVYSTPPTTAASLRIRGALEAWSLPNATDRAGRPQAQLPPAHGTTQYWSNQIRPVAVGNNTTALTRTGNLIRNLAFVNRNVAGARVDTVMPNPAQIQWDARSMNMDTQNYRSQAWFEKSNLSARPTGVFVWNFNHSTDNIAGDDTPTLWWATVQASRLELVGVAEVAGNVQIMTNDIAPGEVTPAERYVETSATGFHPQIGANSPNAQ